MKDCISSWEIKISSSEVHSDSSYKQKEAFKKGSSALLSRAPVPPPPPPLQLLQGQSQHRGAELASPATPSHTAREAAEAAAASARASFGASAHLQGRGRRCKEPVTGSNITGGTTAAIMHAPLHGIMQSLITTHNTSPVTCIPVTGNSSSSAERLSYPLCREHAKANRVNPGRASSGPSVQLHPLLQLLFRRIRALNPTLDAEELQQHATAHHSKEGVTYKEFH